MKSILKVLSNILLFGIPLFIEILSKSRKFDSLLNREIEVVVNVAKREISLEFKRNRIRLMVDNFEDTKEVVNLGTTKDNSSIKEEKDYARDR